MCLAGHREEPVKRRRADLLRPIRRGSVLGPRLDALEVVAQRLDGGAAKAHRKVVFTDVKLLLRPLRRFKRLPESSECVDRIP